MIHTLVYNGISSADYGVYVAANDGLFDSPAPSIDFQSVPGRNGDIIVSNGRFENMSFSYRLMCRDDMTKTIDAVKAWLLSSGAFGRYCRLEDSYYPTYYRMAVVSEKIEVESTFPRRGVVTVHFSGTPQKFLKAGETPINIGTDNATKETVDDKTTSYTAEIFNATAFTAKPLVHVAGSGTFKINDSTVKIQFAKTLDLDCETGDATVDGKNGNEDVTLDTVPSLIPGANKIVFYQTTTGNSLDGLTIIPRWWTI